MIKLHQEGCTSGGKRIDRLWGAWSLEDLKFDQTSRIRLPNENASRRFTCLGMDYALSSRPNAKCLVGREVFIEDGNERHRVGPLRINV